MSLQLVLKKPFIICKSSNLIFLTQSRILHSRFVNSSIEEDPVLVCASKLRLEMTRLIFEKENSTPPVLKEWLASSKWA